MHSDVLAIFVSSVSATEGLPENVKADAGRASSVGLATFDHTYLEFLDEQIELAARDPEWTERLKRRREGLSGLCERPLICGTIEVNHDSYSVKVDPNTGTVVYWEEYKKWT